MAGIPGNPYRILISHAMADEVSFFPEPLSQGQVAWEAAFFKKGAWVTEPIPGLEEYRDYVDGDTTCVYRYIPAQVLLSLIAQSTN